MRPPRPRWRSYLLLSRVSNLPTVWTNVLAGTIVSGTVLNTRACLAAAVAVSLIYTAGMFLNDAFDRAFDSRARPERPIPSGDVGSNEVFGAGAVLMVAGVLLLAWIRPPTLPWTLGLAAAVVYYDYRHKRDRLGPVVMGLCRALVYLVAAVGVTGTVAGAVFVAGGVIWAYVTGLTLLSKRLGPRGRAVTPRLLAGICIVDALIMLTLSQSAPPRPPVLLAIGGFFMTLAAQRWIPGD